MQGSVDVAEVEVCRRNDKGKNWGWGGLEGSGQSVLGALRRSIILSMKEAPQWCVVILVPLRDRI